MRRKHAKKIIAASLVASVLMIIFTITSFQVAQAADVLEFKPQVPIPGMSESEPVGAVMGDKVVSTLLPRYIEIFYNYGLSVAGILAAVMLMAGGTLWLVSGGDSGKVGQAKDIIAGSLIGLVLLFSAYIILNTINPELLKMKPISIDGVEGTSLIQQEAIRFGCCTCKITRTPMMTYQTITEKEFCSSNQGLTAEDCATLCKNAKSEVAGGAGDAKLAIFQHHWDKKCGVETGQTNLCVEYIAAINFTDSFNAAGWKFDPGIEKQIGDMSPELAKLLNCVRANLPSGVGQISSISDNNYIGKLQTCNQALSCQNAIPKCAHSCYSCHYGGGTMVNQSYAVDFGDQTNKSALIAAVQKCDLRSYIKDEGGHLHVSVAKCPRN